MKKELIRLGAQKPALRPHIRPILASLGQGVRTAGAEPLRAQVKNLVTQALSSMEKGALGLPLRGETDALVGGEGFGAAAHTSLESLVVMVALGKGPKSIARQIKKAQKSVDALAVKLWLRHNDHIAGDIPPGKVTYEYLVAQGLQQEAEDLADIEGDLYAREKEVSALLTVEFAPAPRTPGHSEIQVTARWQSNNPYLDLPAGQYYEVFTVPTESASDLMESYSVIEKHVKAALRSLA